MNEYIDLKTNGKLFPTWILANFKEYKLPEIIRSGDPCHEKYEHKFREYQLFVSKYLSLKSPYHNILLYHGLGSGKTPTAINIYNVLYNEYKGWNVFILIKAGLQTSPWYIMLRRWLTMDNYDDRYKNIFFIHYDSPFADKEFMETIKKSDSSKKSLYIIDEVHNFIRNVYSNINSQHGRRAQVIYDYILQDKKENEGVRVVLLSATPIINSPYELALLFNLLRPNIFPKNEMEFNNIFVSSNQTINPVRKNTFQRRILGLVSYYYGSTPDYFASKDIFFVNIQMSEHQKKVYDFYDELESKLKKASVKGSGTYRSYTRQACNFVFPEISEKINGEGRPRPRKFRLSERQAEMLIEGKEKLKEEKGKVFLNVQKYFEALDVYSTELNNYFENLNTEDKQLGHTIENDIENFNTKFNFNNESFLKSEKSKLLSELCNCSLKMIYIILNIIKTKGLVLVYSNYVLMEGIQIFKIYLKWFGFRNFMSSDTSKEGFSYIEFHGKISRKERDTSLEIFNKDENKNGKMIRIVLISPAGAEGIEIYNIRQIHIMEPFWNETRITQMIGRGLRRCSHKNLPLEERHVDIFRYKSIYEGKETADEYIEKLALEKEGLIQSFLNTIKESAVDCELNKTHNMLTTQYNCFKFDESTLFEKQIGPAYKMDLQDDIKIDNGSNSIFSQTIKLKIFKIKAVIKLNNKKYSSAKDYWFNPESSIVYDYDLKFPIGKLEKDDDGLFIKLDMHTYVISYMIPIPLVK